MSHQLSITGVTGTPPYSISVCDLTLNYCYLITGSTTIPPTFTFDIPAPLDVVNNVIVKVTDSNGCQIFLPYSCPPTPTPTPTITPTPSSTPTSDCRCIQITNTGVTTGSFYYTKCDGSISSVIPINSGTTLYYCGTNPINVSNCDIYIGDNCVENSCVSTTPTPTPTNSPTPSITPSVTPTISITPSVSVTPSVTPTISVTPSITPTVSPTPSVTPTITPTTTPTPSPLPPLYAYLFIEPISASTNIGNYMFSNGSTQFFGFSNTTQPSTSASTFNTEMNLYVNYSGWTNGELPSIYTSLVPQISGGIDSFGNPKVAYNFETLEIPQNTISGNAWYTWIIAVSLTNNQIQTDIDLGLGNPNVFTNVLTESTITTNTFTFTGSTIPPVTYRVYTTYPSGDFLIDNQTTDIYFKGGDVT